MTTTTTTRNRPCGMQDPQGNVMLNSWEFQAYRGDLESGPNLILIGYARPGSLTSQAVWQIKQITYSGSTAVAIEWPQNPQGNASSDYQFVWDDRASYTYS